jgi:hypothetical protein
MRSDRGDSDGHSPIGFRAPGRPVGRFLFVSRTCPLLAAAQKVAGWLRVTATAASYSGGVERSLTQKPWRAGNAFTWNPSTSQTHFCPCPYTSLSLLIAGSASSGSPYEREERLSFFDFFIGDRTCLSCFGEVVSGAKWCAMCAQLVESRPDTPRLQCLVNRDPLNKSSFAGSLESG